MFMGLATTLLFGDSTMISTVLYTLSSISLNIGMLVFLPMIVICLAAGTASLRKDKLTPSVILPSLLWTVATAIILPVVAVLLLSAFPVVFPVSSTAGGQGFSSSFVSSVLASGRASLMTGNIFYTLATTSSFLLPVIIIAWILGYALKPNADVIKPAYTVMNSFSEVMYRIARAYSVLGYILVYCTSAYFFTSLYQEKTIFAAPTFLVTYILIVLALAVIVLPLLFVAFTKGKRNPYKVLFRSIAPAVAGLTSGSFLFASPVMISCSRHSLGVQKRVASTTIPLFSIIGKAGSAAVASLSAISLVYAVTGTVPTVGQSIVIALCCGVASFTASVASGFESIFITLCAFRLTGISLYGAEATLIGLMPLISGLGAIIDVEAAMLGTAAAGNLIETDINAPYKDII